MKRFPGDRLTLGPRAPAARRTDVDSRALWASMSYQRPRHSRLTREALLQLLLGFGGIFVLMPFVFAVSVSLRTDAQWMTKPLTWLPDPVVFEHYEFVVTASLLGRWAFNTLVVVGLSLVGTVLSCALVAYPLARIPFRGRSLVFLCVISTIVMPPQVLIIPQYLLFFRLGWIDTSLPLIIPSFFGLSGIYVFLFRQHFRTVPRDLEEAAQVDGAGHFATFVRVFLPISLGPIAIVTILHVVSTYNDYFTPLIYLHSADRQTLAVGIAGMGKYLGASIVSTPLSMAAALAFASPLILFFFAVQRFIMKGIDLQSGIKG